jgi:hypothetical protein
MSAVMSALVLRTATLKRQLRVKRVALVTIEWKKSPET